MQLRLLDGPPSSSSSHTRTLESPHTRRAIPLKAIWLMIMADLLELNVPCVRIRLVVPPHPTTTGSEHSWGALWEHLVF